MIPVLYSPNEYAFKTNGIGRLYDAISCEVTEERNGIYELSLEYPINGMLYKELRIFNIILAKPNDADDPQPFDIYNVDENGETAKVRARHIAYRLSYMPCKNFSGVSTVSAALTKLAQAMAFTTAKYSSNYLFRFTSDVNDITTAFYVETSYTAKTLLNKIAETYGKTFHYDKFTVSLINRGEDNGITLRRGLNILSVSKERNTDGAYNAVCDYYYQKDKGLKLGTSNTIDSETLPYPRALIEDVTREYTADTVPSVSAMDQRATAMLTSQNVVGGLSVEVDMAALWDSEEYESYKALMHIGLCDTVRVYYPEIDLNIKVTAEKLVYDSLLERTKSITLSSQGKDLSRTIAETNAKQAEAEQNHLVNVFGGRAVVSGRTTLEYSSATRLVKSIATGLSYVDEVFVTMGNELNTPWALVTALAALRNVNGDTVTNGHIKITAAGSFVSGHVLAVYWIAVGKK